MSRPTDETLRAMFKAVFYGELGADQTIRPEQFRDAYALAYADGRADEKAEWEATAKDAARWREFLQDEIALAALGGAFFTRERFTAKVDANIAKRAAMARRDA